MELLGKNKLNTEELFKLDNAITHQNKHGDIALYTVLDGKHTMFIYNAETGISELSTITEIPQGYAFLYQCEGSVSNEVWPDKLGNFILMNWLDMPTHLDIVCDRK